MIRVMERGRPTSGTWYPSRGLENIPPEMAEQVRCTVLAANAKLGWTKYQVHQTNPPYQECLRAE